MSPTPKSRTRPGLPRRLQEPLEAQDPQPSQAAARTDPARQAEALGHARACARIADDNRARDVAILDLRQATPLVDYFVLATALSPRQATAIAIETDAEMKRLGERKLGMEGSEEGRWILIDYGDFVIHIFSDDAREYYALEDLWGDAVRIPLTDAPTPTEPPSS